MTRKGSILFQYPCTDLFVERQRQFFCGTRSGPSSKPLMRSFRVTFPSPFRAFYCFVPFFFVETGCPFFFVFVANGNDLSPLSYLVLGFSPLHLPPSFFVTPPWPPQSCLSLLPTPFLVFEGSRLFPPPPPIPSLAAPTFFLGPISSFLFPVVRHELHYFSFFFDPLPRIFPAQWRRFPPPRSYQLLCAILFPHKHGLSFTLFMFGCIHLPWFLRAILTSPPFQWKTSP